MIIIKNFGQKYFRFINSKGDLISLSDKYPTGYYDIWSFNVIDNGIIISYGYRDDINNSDKRRNIFKFDENGQIVWQIQDHFDYWNKYPSEGQEKFLKNFENCGYGNILEDNGKIIGDIGVYQFEINPDNGHITLMEPTIWR